MNAIEKITQLIETEPSHLQNLTDAVVALLVAESKRCAEDHRHFWFERERTLTRGRITSSKPSTPPAPEGCRWDLRDGKWCCYQGHRKDVKWFLTEEKGFDWGELDGGRTPENLRIAADAIEMLDAWMAA